MPHLSPDTTLQGGKYKIVKTLGQGGFGITYLAIQTNLNRRVAIKEFFMKDFCERNAATRHVTIGSTGSRETVSRFREKFRKEARHIAKFNHSHIVRIIDVFDENETAYYVMDYIENGSLAELVEKQGALAESVATRYILQVADALDYIHQHKMNHLDVKPANIMLNENDEAVLIDFGLSKQYDATTGSQTSNTPLGISEGFAPMEQYKQGGVGEFTPETDIYALGATFFYLLTGTRPPSAPDIVNDGLPLEPLRSKGVSEKAIAVICKAMEGRKKDRLHHIRTFIDSLTADANKPSPPPVASPLLPQKDTLKPTSSPGPDQTILKNEASLKNNGKEVKAAPSEKKKHKWAKVGVPILLAVIILLVIVFAVFIPRQCSSPNEVVQAYSLEDTFNGVLSINGVDYRMVKVDGGTFTMGATDEMTDPNDYEKPTHQVTLSSYYIGETEVTQALWKAVMGNNPSMFKGDNLPVENVSWNDCQEFIRKLNAATGRRFRLPTEAEWEFAARGGNQSRHTQYSGSSNIDDVAWYYDNSGNKTHPVKTKRSNELGLYDMTGNVWEWCQDWFGSYSSYSQTNPTGPNSGSDRVLRGGSWYSYARYCRSSYRYSAPGNRSSNLGFRLALSE